MGNILKLITDDTLSVQTGVKAEELLKKKSLVLVVPYSTE